MIERKGLRNSNKLSAEHAELLALLLEEEGIESPQAQTIPRRSNTDAIPLSFAQQRLWFLDQLVPGNAFYNLARAIRLKGSIDVAALERSFDEIVRRHEALRTTFVTMEGLPAQVINAHQPLILSQVDLRALPATDLEAGATRMAVEEAKKPFDLASGPLLRLLLLRLKDEEYVVVMVIHHIISDAWSMGIFIREMIALYQAFSASQSSTLEELRIQYADFAVWQRQWLQGKVLEDHLSFWKQQLGGTLPILQLPTDNPHPSVQTFSGAHQSFRLSPQLTSSLKALSHNHATTLFMTLLAAYKTMLYRYTGQEDIIVGTPIANRQPAETEPLMGFFVNTLPLRASLSGNPSFIELLKEVREITLQAYAHADLPFEKLVDALQPERNLSHTPIFQVMFAFDNVPVARAELESIEIELLDVDVETTKFDLSLEATETPLGIGLSFDYNADLFDETTIIRMAGHFQRLLESIVENPQSRICDLPLLSAQELHQIRFSFNDTYKDFPRHLCIHELFEAQVERSPEAVAVVCQSQSLTYRQLNERANRLAHYLKSRGAGPEKIVAICLERGLDLVVAVMAALKSSSAYLPLDPSYPQERLAFMLGDAKPAVLLTQQPLLERLPASESEVICLDSDWKTISQSSRANPANQVSGEDAAYVIYTSGSTGHPKGAVNTHFGLANRLLWMQETFELEADDCVLQKTPFSFDVSVWEFFWPLMVGARLVVAKPGGHQDSEYLVSLITQQQVTTLHFVPSMLQVFLQEPELNACESLKRVICSGEALPVELVQLFYSRAGADLYNLYGPTEAAIDVTSWKCERENKRQSTPIGKPISNTQIYLLNSRLQPVPVGVTGELHIGGVGLARGYLNRPEMTAEKFIPAPFADRPGERLYKSGDHARLLPDGRIEFLGRIDHQVKLRGFRIELEEIERALRARTLLAEAAVIVYEDTPGHKQLVAYVVSKQEPSPSINDLRSFLKKRLPEYMIPASFVWLEKLPLTINGKVDRRALPSPGQKRPGLDEAYVAPRTETEEILAAIWSQVLKLDEVGVEDNFFAIGGDSIRSVQVLALARARGVNFTLQQLFQHQTISELASMLKPGEADLVPAVRSQPFSLISDRDYQMLPGDVEDAYPLAMLQAGMLFHLKYMPDQPVYHNVNSYHLRARFESENFQRSVQWVVARHPVLRTSFNLDEYSEPLQLVHREAYLPVGVEDIRHLSYDEQERLIDNFVEDEKRRRFDYSQPPLLRFHIHLRDDDTFQLTLTECHPIFDGWSLQSTLAEIFEYYFAALDNEPLPDEPPPASSFRDFVLLERMALESEEGKRFWKEKLRDCTIMDTPKWPMPAHNNGGPRVLDVGVPIPEEVSEGLRALARNAAVPLKSVLLAAHIKVMSLISGQTDIITGLVSNGRPEELDGERVRGLFLNTLPFRQRLSGGSWLSLARQTFDSERELLPYRRYPLAMLQRNFGNQPLFETVFNYVHFHVVEGVLRSGKVKMIGVDKGSEETNFTLIAGFMTDIVSSQVHLILGCDLTKLNEAQIDSIRSYYQQVLAAMVADPSARHDTQCLLPAEEQYQLLVEWNNTEALRENRCVHALFESQAEKIPDALAVAFEDKQLSYFELNQRANQLAHYLRARGVKPEVLVGICVERSVEMVVGMLAVLKAGGAFLPLDHTYPKHRLAFMIEDAQVSILLTQSKLTENLPAQVDEIVCLDTGWATIARQNQENPESAVIPDNLAYVIYTSGSTGKPKGTEIPHAGLMNLVSWHQKTYSLSPEDRATQLAGLSFDASVWELWPYLAAGASLHIVDERTRTSPDKLVQWLYEKAITISFLPTPLAEAVLGEPWPQRIALRALLTGGDKLHRGCDQTQSAELINHYGPTENTVVTTSTLVGRIEDSGKAPPIGKPIANTVVYVLNESLQPLAIGAVGELLIGGDSLARGYLKRPDLTAEKFIPNPFGQQAGARMYRTGDLVRYQPDGNIEFAGRADQQVKIRGFRIELGEIEAVLAIQPSVREAVVVPVKAAAGEPRLVAYLVTDQPAPTANELQNSLKQKLPDYMVPSEFVLLDALPVTPNGKVDRKALPDPEGIGLKATLAYVAPTTEAEQQIASIWQEVLQIEKPGIHDNFFDVGGHSLKMAQVQSKLEKLFNRELSIVEMFEHPTIGSLASFLSNKQDEPPSTQRREELAGKLKEGKQRLRQRLLDRRAEKGMRKSE